MVRPLLRRDEQSQDLESMQSNARGGLQRLLSLRSHEAAFIEALWERGEIQPDLLTSNPEI